MQSDELVIEVRDKDFRRMGRFSDVDKVEFLAVLRYNAVGSWQARLSIQSPMGQLLSQPGYGIIVSNAQGTLFSGPVTQVITTQDTEDTVGTYQISGVSDDVVLADRLTFPEPSNPDAATQTLAYDQRNGAAETVIKGYVNANLGPDAPTERQAPGVVVAPTQGRGLTVRTQARFNQLLETIQPLADLAGLGFQIKQQGTELVFDVYEPTDRAASIRLDLQNGRLTRSEFALAQPLATRIIVAGQGTGADRTLVPRTNSAAEEAEETWQRRVELFVDRRDTDDLVTLEQAGDEILVTDGKTRIGVSISPSDDQTMLFGVDWNLGDKVTCVIGPTEVQAVVTEVGISVETDGVRIGATVGEPRGFDYETQILTKQAQQSQRISQLERT
jgi:hypothetical protein